jgi:hypothetical protein
MFQHRQQQGPPATNQDLVAQLLEEFEHESRTSVHISCDLHPGMERAHKYKCANTITLTEWVLSATADLGAVLIPMGSLLSALCCLLSALCCLLSVACSLLSAVVSSGAVLVLLAIGSATSVVTFAVRLSLTCV